MAGYKQTVELMERAAQEARARIERGELPAAMPPAAREADEPDGVFALNRRFLSAYRRKKALEAEAKAAAQEAESLAAVLAERYVTEGCQSMKCEGALIYVQRDLYVSVRAEAKATAVAVLEAHGLRDLISPQPAKLTAYVREQVGEAAKLAAKSGRGNVDLSDELPPWLAPVVSVFSRVNLRVKGAGDGEE